MDSCFGSGVSYKVFILQSMQIACSTSPHSDINNENPNENRSTGKKAWLVRKGQWAYQMPLETVDFYLSLEWGCHRRGWPLADWMEGRVDSRHGLCREGIGVYAFPDTLGIPSWDPCVLGNVFSRKRKKKKRRKTMIYWSSVFFSPHNSWLHFLIVITTKNQRSLYRKCNCVEILIQIQARSSDTSQYQN